MHIRLLVILLVCMPCALSRVQSQTHDSTLVMTKNPTTAVLYSLLLPGLGQYYNEDHWKIPLFTGTCAVTGYLFFKYNADFNTADDLYEQALASGADATVTDRLLSQREASRDNRDLSGVIFLTAYTLAAIDAYVGAHLFDFDVGDDLSVGFGPSSSHIAAVNLRLRW